MWGKSEHAVPESSQEPLQQKGLTAERVPSSQHPAVTAGSIWEKTEIVYLQAGSPTGQGGCDDDVIIITAYSLSAKLSFLWNLNWSLKLTVKESWCSTATKWMIVSVFCFLNKKCKRSNFWSTALQLHLLCLVVAPSQTPFSKPILQVYLYSIITMFKLIVKRQENIAVLVE